MLRATPGTPGGLRLGTFRDMLRLFQNGDAYPGNAASGQPSSLMGQQARRRVWLTRSTSLNWDAFRRGKPGYVCDATTLKMKRARPLWQGLPDQPNSTLSVEFLYFVQENIDLLRFLFPLK